MITFPVIWISNELLDQADPKQVVIDGDIVKFGDITYRITERYPRHVVAVRVETPRDGVTRVYNAAFDSLIANVLAGGTRP
jgi:hypothetical protein